MNRCCQNKKGFTIIFVFILCSRLIAQPAELELKRSFQGAPFSDFVNYIEDISDYCFFYEPAWVDTLSMNHPDDIGTLDKVLAHNLSDYNIYYAITAQGYIILSKNNKLKLSLPDDFFSVPETELSGISSGMPNPLPKPINKNTEPGMQPSGLIELGNPALQNEEGKVNLSGFIKDYKTGEPMIGAIAYVEELGIGTATNLNGYYIISIPRGYHQISYQSLGKEKITGKKQ